MKSILRSFLLAAALLFGSASFLWAQNVSTGVIAGFQPKAGTLTIRSDQTQGLVTFFGVDKANIFTADGKISTIKDLPLGSKVTVEFAEKDKQWYVSKVILPAEGKPGGVTPAPNSIVINAEPPTSKNRDDDITTRSDVQRGRVEALKRQ